MIHSEPVASLLLDESNARFREDAPGQDAALTDILKLAWQKVFNLAKDIIEQDSVNPTEVPIAVHEHGCIVVIEGNRRLAALKLLRHPELAREASVALDEDLVERFRQLQKLGTGPDSIDVYIAKSREAAKHWIDLRHTGENNGVGVVPWETWQVNNFRRRRGSQADKATIFCDSIEVEYPNEDDLLVKVETVRRTRLTTLGRLVGDPFVRRDFGFDFFNDQVIFEYSSDDMLPGIQRIFSDLADTVTVTNIKTKSNRENYVRDRAPVLPPRERKLAKPRLPGEKPSGFQPSTDQEAQTEEKPTNGDASQSSEEKKRRNREQPQERMVFEGVKLPHLNGRIRNLLKQAQKINIDDSPQVTAILVRVLVELVVTEAIMRSVVKGNEGDSLKKKIENALLTLDPNCGKPSKRDKSLEMAWTRTQGSNETLVQSLHAFVHNPHGAATPQEVREFSATFRKMLESLDDLIGQVPQ